MRLTDIMSAAGLAGWAEAALILFFVAFCAIVIRIFWPGRRRELESRKHLPFADDESADPATGGKRP